MFRGGDYSDDSWGAYGIGDLFEYHTVSWNYGRQVKIPPFFLTIISRFWRSVFGLFFDKQKKRFLIRPLDHCYMKNVLISSIYVYVFKYSICCFVCCLNYY